MKIAIEIWGTTLVGLAGIGAIAYYVHAMPMKSVAPTVSELMDQCVVYNSAPGTIAFKREEINRYLHKVDAQQLADIAPDLRKSFSVCTQELKVNLKKYGALVGN